MRDAYFPGGPLHEKLLNSLFITECAFCGTQLPEQGLCSSCHAALEFAETQEPVFEISVGNIAIPCASCFVYEDDTVKSLLFHLKRKSSPAVVNYAALKIKRAVSLVNAQGNVVFTNVPRSSAGKLRYGFDQSELIAVKTSRMCEHSTYIKMLARKGYSHEQKKLSAEQRKHNTKGKFRTRILSKKINPDSIVVFDDVITTGNSMVECLELLHKAYPQTSLYAVVLAR